MITATVLGSGSYLNEAEVTAADQQDFDSTPGNAATQQEDDNDGADLDLVLGVDGSAPLLYLFDSGAFAANTSLIPSDADADATSSGSLTPR